MGVDTRHGAAVEQLDEQTKAQWMRLSAQMVAASVRRTPSDVNAQLEAAIRSEPQSPVAPVYRLWIAESFAREACYKEAIGAYDSTVEMAQSARPFFAELNITNSALLHKAQAASIGGDAKLAISTYRELAKVSRKPAEALYQAGLLAEMGKDDEQAAEFYRSVASGKPSSRTDDFAELARRALQRLNDSNSTYFATAEALADILTQSLATRDITRLDHLVSKTHFAVGVVGGHAIFEKLELLETFYRDLLDSRVKTGGALVGSGEKLYLPTRGWKGAWFRGDITCLLTRTPKGWQWTGVGISEVNDLWVGRWRPATQPTNQPLPFPLRAPWPAGQSFKAGGFTEYVGLQTTIALLGWPTRGLLELYLARNPCGFGPRGFYYNQFTHDEADAFAIDFTRYRRNVPYYPESGGTPVLAAHNGVVASVSAGRESGDSSGSNTVEIVHQDPNNPADTDRYRSLYLHLAGPFMIPVSVGMPVITGQRLGLMDDTGNSWINHLHFSIHDRNLPHPSASYGRSVRPTPLEGVHLGDGDSGACIRSSNVERFPGLNFRPTIVSFGSVAVGQTATRTLWVENSSGTSVNIDLPASPAGSVFQWEGFSGTVADRAETSFSLTFQPTRNDIERGSLIMMSTAPGSPHSVGLIGKGPGGFPEPEPEPFPQNLDITPALINFGSVAVGSTQLRTLTIKNPTGLDANLSIAGPSSASVFQWDSFNGVLSPGSEISVNVSFTPKSNAIERTVLIVASTAAGSPDRVGIIGKGPGGFPVPEE